MKGTRIYPDKNGNLSFAAGDYGKTNGGEWLARPPKGHTGTLSQHEVTEHEDGTISVSPSILITGEGRTGKEVWHGYLEKGIWREV